MYDFNLSGTNDTTKSGFGLGTYELGTLNAVNGGGAGATMGSNTGLPSATVDPISSGTNQFGQMGGGGNFWSKDGGAGMVLGGVQVLGNLWSTYQQQKMAKEQMSFAREQWDTNLANQTQTYNTALRDKAQGAANYAGKAGDPNFVDDYVDRNKL